MTRTELSIRGRNIRIDDAGLVCLNDIWSAAGYSVNQRPSDWTSLPVTLKLIELILGRNTGKSGNWTKTEIRSVYYAKRGQGGGTFVDPRLAVSYAEYLSPRLALEVKEVFLRYRAADPSLADEILERASPQANLWAASRAQARVIRNEYTATLRDHDVKGRGYMECTDEAYLRLFDGPAWKLRQQRGLAKGANVRDSMNMVELSAVKLTEALAAERITDEDRRGNQDCKLATGKTAMNVRRAIESDRQDRQKRLLP